MILIPGPELQGALAGREVYYFPCGPRAGSGIFLPSAFQRVASYTRAACIRQIARIFLQLSLMPERTLAKENESRHSQIHLS